MRRLVEPTIVRGPSGGAVVLEAGQELPLWAVDQVGEHLLDGEADLVPPVVQDVNPPEPPGVQEAEEPEVEASQLVPPPIAGAGSGQEAWLQYGRAAGLVLDEDTTRADIIEQLEAADIPTRRG